MSERICLKRFYYELQKETLIDLLDTKYSNDKLTYEYIQHFKRQSQRTCIETHRILFCNEYISHFT